MSFLIIILISSQSHAEPSKLITKMLATQVSTLDFYLFRIEEQSKCNRGWFGNSKNNDSKKPCLTTLDYNFEDNLIKMHFFVDDTNAQMINFETSNDKYKENTLKEILAGIVILMGVEEDKGLKFGMIQMTNIRNGWSNKGFDESKIKDEIAKRTVIAVTANIKDGFVYRATRNHHGKVFFEKKKFPL